MEAGEEVAMTPPNTSHLDASGTVTSTGNMTEQIIERELKLQSETIRNLEGKMEEIFSILPNSDEILHKSIESLAHTVRNLIHNQQVMETKFEDLLKNQANSDTAINSLTKEISKINRFLTDPNGPLSVTQNGHITTQRGPGRPPKKPSSLLLNGELKAQLPFGNVDISKSKRFFQDPHESNGTSRINNQMQQEVVQVPAKMQYPQEPKKRRGRPSKKRKWQEQQLLAMQQQKLHSSTEADEHGSAFPISEISETGETVSADVPLEANTEDSLKDREPTAKVLSRRKSLRSKRATEHVYEDQSDLSSVAPPSEDDTHEEMELGDDGYNTDEQKQSGGESDDSTERKQREIERRRDERERMLVTMKYSDRNATKTFMELNKELLMAMKQEERRKRMTSSHIELGVPLGKYNISGKSSTQSPLAHVPFSLSQPSDSSSRVQTPTPQQLAQNSPSSSLDLHVKEPEEESSSTSKEGDVNSKSDEVTQSMLVNGHKEKSLDEIAKKEEVSVAPKSPSDESAASLSSDIQSTRKIGIMSILNNDEANSEGDESNTVLQSKRPLEDSASRETSVELQQTKIKSAPFSITTLGTTVEPIKKRRMLTNDDRREMSKLIPMLPEKKDNRGRPSSNNQSQENAASLLMSSPVELYCRQGFFYEKSSNVPITAGQYLDLKFRHKEEELIKLTMNEEDYAEITRQDRINAYFLKPDVDIETAMACQVLSNVILTERYVNSLEYFLMEFRWENRLVSLGLKLRESKRTWQRRKALFALFEFWRDKSRDKRGFADFTLLHAVKEMENYRVFINRSVSWFYNHITLLKMILFDLCDNTDTNWREWMFDKNAELPVIGQNGVDVASINKQIDNLLTLDFLEDGSKNSTKKSSSLPFKQDADGNPVLPTKESTEDSGFITEIKLDTDGDDQEEHIDGDISS